MEETVAKIAEHISSHFYGKYPGIVQSVDDPENRGRIQARVDDVYQEETSPWALPASPFAGDKHGLILLPEEGDGVWIEFVAGDISRPIWTGGWWATGKMPADGGKDKRAFVTSKGHKLVLDDGGNIVQLLHAGGAELTMTDQEITLKIGSAQIKLSSEGVDINNGALKVI